MSALDVAAIKARMVAARHPGQAMDPNQLREFEDANVRFKAHAPEDIAALIEAVARLTWKPIADAPRDGRELWLWFTKFACAGYWSEDAQRWRLSERTLSGAAPAIGTVEAAPTHYMELPEGPES